ncbi:hypothetical protein LCGC14_1028260 [marine sediment metagenome]|uniref:Uncharacterized protein n=1 Tax=marine sediment metagenome TaxID=412755 RepID=A0A0F9N037_9ZZZZ
MSHQPIKNWIICICGFLQSEGTPNGVVGLWSWLHSEHSVPDTRVELRAWNDRWSELAELIWRMRPADNHVSVKIVGYSFGGYSATLLAKELGKRGIEVRAMVLSDPVYRHWHRLGWWRAMWPWSEIKIPSNVREVWWFRQRQNLPRGHELVAEKPRNTTIHEPRVLKRDHAWMDDAAEFKNTAMVVARGD